MKVYSSAQQLKAYINIGGGVASKGLNEYGTIYTPGLNFPQDVPRLKQAPLSVMRELGLKGVPLIYLRHATQLAKAYGMPVGPVKNHQQGKGRVYQKREYSRYYAAVFLVVLISGLAVPLLNRMRKGSTNRGDSAG